MGRRGDGETGRRGDGEMGRRGDGETGRRGDGETWRRGDGETGRWGDGAMGRRGDGEFVSIPTVPQAPGIKRVFNLSPGLILHYFRVCPMLSPWL